MSSNGFQPPRPVLSSQQSQTQSQQQQQQPEQQQQQQQQQQQTRYSPTSDYVDTTTARRSLHIDTTGRLPLRDATGGHVPQSFSAGLVSCYQSPVGISPTSSGMPHHRQQHQHQQQPNGAAGGIPPPIVPSQSFDCLYRDQVPRHQARFHQHQQQQQRQRKSRNDINPLYFWPAFRQYRNRQAHKDTQKDKGGVWRRPELEDAFVDSVLLMPHMGRRKFSMGGKLHGRNMLISEYIFVICVEVLGSTEIFRIDNSNDSIEQMGRKQVSSHMQVVKKFFEDLRCFHFFFPSEEKREPGTTQSDDFYEDEEQESFKANPVLTALAEGRVPDVRPNYEYFSQLLQLQSSITMRPKTCELIVASPEVRIKDDMAYDARGRPLDTSFFPHLNKYTHCDDGPHILKNNGVLLHEYTRPLDRTTSACVKTVTRRWQREAPALLAALELPARDRDCLLIEMCTTLEINEKARFPRSAELTSLIEMAITQPQLQNHRWKCVTRLTRPPELQGDRDDEAESDDGVITLEAGIHRARCGEDVSDCDCHLHPRQDIHLPFPAPQWVTMLSAAGGYPDKVHQELREKRNKSGGGGGGGNGDDKQAPSLDRSGSSKRKKLEDEGEADAWGGRQPTGSDLICKVAMFQELWSCAPDSPGRWTRQAIVFWRFNTTNQWYKYKPVFRPAGTTWRWLTVNDPVSKYHQQKALVYPSGLPRDSVMSPSPSIGQHLTAAMSETFGTWDRGMAGGAPGGGPGGGLTFLDTFSSGLATPPPTASLHGSYSSGSSSSFDAAAAAAAAGVGFLPTTCAAPAPDSSLAQSHHHHQAFYDASTHASAVNFADVKPLPSALTSYLPPGPGPLDLSSQGLYDHQPSMAQPSQHQHHHQQQQQHSQHHHTGSQPGMSAWDMPSIASAWGPTPSANSTSSAGAGASAVVTAAQDWASTTMGVKADPQQQQAGDVWGTVQWTQPPTPTGHHHHHSHHHHHQQQQQQQQQQQEQDLSPRPTKRRRGNVLDPMNGPW